MGINYLLSKPATPVIGDTYFCSNTRTSKIWMGSSWEVISAEATLQPSLLPSNEELSEHISLKQAWEEYCVIRRLLGL
jgi:hypothetical protein